LDRIQNFFKPLVNFHLHYSTKKCRLGKKLWVYNKNCGKKMFGKKMYPAPGGNLVDQATFKNIGEKITDFY